MQVKPWIHSSFLGHFLNISYAPSPSADIYRVLQFKVSPFFEMRQALEVYKYNMHLHM